MVFTCFPGQGQQFGQQGHLTMGCSGSTEWRGQNDKSIFSFRKAIVMDDCVGSLSTSWAFTSGIALKTERNAPWVSAGMCKCETGEQLGVVGTDSYSWTLHWAYAVNRRGKLWEKLHTAVCYFFCMCPSMPLWAARLRSTQALCEAQASSSIPFPCSAPLEPSFPHTHSNPLYCSLGVLLFCTEWYNMIHSGSTSCKQ